MPAAAGDEQYLPVFSLLACTTTIAARPTSSYSAVCSCSTGTIPTATLTCASWTASRSTAATTPSVPAR